MKQTLKLAAALAVLGLSVGATTSAMAQTVAGSTGTTLTASLNVVCPLMMNSATTLAFGNLVGGEATPATVTILPQQTFSETYGAGDAADPGTGNFGTGTRQQGEIDLSGSTGFLWTLISPPSTAALSYTGTTDLSTVNLTYSSTSGTLAAGSSNAAACAGAAKVYVGGSVNVDAGTGTGTYTGTVSIKAAYN